MTISKATPKKVVSVKPATAKTMGAKPRVVQAAKSTAKAVARPNGKKAPEDTKKPKHKLVRDSFTIPKAEYAVLESLKARAIHLRRPTKKSEMLRAGIAALNAMSDQTFLQVLNSIPSLKTGRPVSNDAAPQPVQQALR